MLVAHVWKERLGKLPVYTMHGVGLEIPQRSNLIFWCNTLTVEVTLVCAIFLSDELSKDIALLEY